MDGSFEQPPADPGTSPDLDPGVCAAAAKAAVVRACIGQINTSVPPLLRDRAPDALHQVRVALRRWRSAQAVFGKLDDGGDAVTAELRWLAGELDEARDLDVFEQGMTSAAGRKGVVAELPPLGQALSQARSEAYARAVRALESDRCRRLLWDAARNTDAAPDSDGAAPSARQCARAALERQMGKLTKQREAFASLGVQARHKLRIAAKKARYTAEMLGPLFDHPKRRRRFIKALKTFQGVMGELNDIHVGRSVAERLAAMTGQPEAAFTAGLLAGVRFRHEDALLKQAAKAYDSLLETKPFW